jgi:hypothetical protein
MIRLNDSILVERPVEEAFAYVSDFATVAEWDPGVEVARRIEGDAPGVGATYQVVATFRGRRIDMRYETIEFHTPERVVLLGEGPNISARDSISFERLGSSLSRITYEAEFSLRWPWRLLEWPLRPTFKRLGQDALDGLQRVLGPATDAGRAAGVAD